MVWGRCWSGDLGRSGVWRRVVLQRRCRAPGSRRTAWSRTLTARRGSRLRWLRISIGGWVGWVATKVLGRSRRRVEAWWTLRTAAEVWWHTLRLLGLLGRRRKTGAALGSAAGHYAAEEIAGTVADLRWLRSRRAAVLGILAGAAAGFQIALKMRNPLLVLGLHLVVLLLEVVDLAADHLNLLDMAGDLAFVVDTALRLCLELGPDVVEQLVEALGWADLGTPHYAGRWVAVVHGDGL